ncbi:MAG: LVIVD repeat-containing protein, partial [Bryobacteraceae bacterium]
MELVGYNDLQGRAAYQPIVINENGREIAYVGHHTGSALNPLTGAEEPNGTSILDVTDPAKPKYLAHIPGSSTGGEEAGGSQMVRVCSGSVLPHGVHGKWYLLRPFGTEAQEIYDVTDPVHPTRLTVIVSGLNATHKNWWECDTGIAYLVANAPAEGWKGQHLKIYDLSDPAKPVYIRDIGLLGQQPGQTSHEGLVAGIMIHGAISAGPEKNRVYAAYGVGANGVIQILDRKKLLTDFENPKKPTTEEMLAPQVGYITMSPDQGGHTAFPVFGVPIPEFQQFSALKKRDLLIVPSEASRGDHCGPDPGTTNRAGPHLAFLLD